MSELQTSELQMSAGYPGRAKKAARAAFGVASNILTQTFLFLLNIWESSKIIKKLKKQLLRFKFKGSEP